MARLAAGFTKRKDGRLQYRFTANGKRYTIYGWTTAEVREKERQKRDEIEKGIAARGKNVTMSNYVDQWIERKRGVVKDASICCYRHTFKVVLSAPVNGQAFGNMKVADVEAQDVKAVQQELLKTETIRTTNHYIALLRSVMKSAVNDDNIRFTDPTAPIKPMRDTTPPAREGKHRALTREETKAFFDHCDGSWFTPLYHFLLETGCRCGEAGALQLRDIHREAVTIQRTLTTSEFGLVIGDSTKTEAGRRTVPLTEAAKKAIAEQREKNAVMFGREEGLTNTIFKTATGAVLYNPTLNADIRRICKRAGIERFTAHAFRDTFATRCVESGMNFKTLQAIMGHSDIGMTMNLYAHVMPDTKKEQMKVVDFY